YIFLHYQSLPHQNHHSGYMPLHIDGLADKHDHKLLARCWSGDTVQPPETTGLQTPVLTSLEYSYVPDISTHSTGYHSLDSDVSDWLQFPRYKAYKFPQILLCGHQSLFSLDLGVRHPEIESHYSGVLPCLSPWGDVRGSQLPYICLCFCSSGIIVDQLELFSTAFASWLLLVLPTRTYGCRSQTHGGSCTPKHYPFL